MKTDARLLLLVLNLMNYLNNTPTAYNMQYN